MIKNLFLAGAAIRTISILGAISHMEDNNKLVLSKVDNFIGSSGGSIICYLLSMGYDIKMSFTIITKLMMVYNKTNTDPNCIFNLFGSFGLDNGEFLTKWVLDTTFDKLKLNNPTFIEFAKATGKNLSVCATNISKMKLTMFNVNNTPNIKVSDAIRASISIPLLFTPVIINEDYYVDSGVLNNFPIDFVDFTSLSRFDTIGLCIKINTTDGKIPNIIAYAQQIFVTVSNNNSINNPLLNKKNIRIIEIHVDDSNMFLNFNFDSFKMALTSDILTNYFNIGYAHMSSEEG